jgi:di/tricarboxylate transporter
MLLTNPKMPIAELMTNGDDDNITFWLVIILLLIALGMFSNNTAAAIQNVGIIISYALGMATWNVQ